MESQEIKQLVMENDLSTEDLIQAATLKLSEDCIKYRNPIKKREKEMIFDLFKLVSYSEDSNRLTEFSEEVNEKYLVNDE